MSDALLSVAWHVPVLNERRASLRYRCIYPMRELQRLGHVAEIYDERSALRHDVLILDAWMLFPTTASPDVAGSVWRAVQQARSKGTRIVLDNCDNQFSGKPSPAWSAACDQLVRLAQTADRVTTCSEALASAMQRHCGLAKLPSVVGDPVEVAIQYTADSRIKAALSIGRKKAWWRLRQHTGWLREQRRQGRTALVWFGSSGNAFADGGLSDLRRILPLLQEIDPTHPLSLSIVSNNFPLFQKTVASSTLNLRYLEWDRTTFLQALRLHDVSVIPVSVNEFTVCKSANRLTLSLHNGLNVVCDGIPAYMPYASVCAIDNWESGLRRYLDDQALRAEHVRLGREMVSDQCNINAIARSWVRALESDPVN